MSSDGGESYDEGVGVLLVRCGRVPADLMDRLAGDLSQFINQAVPSDLPRPTVSIASAADPIISNEQSDEWEDAFRNLLQRIPRSSITILVTEQGIWYTHPYPRFIFAHVYGGGAALLSIRRFRSPNRMAMYDRLGKEVVKVLGMALGVAPCQDDRCIMSYHWSPEDLDRNTGVCPECRELMTGSLAGLLQKEDGPA